MMLRVVQLFGSRLVVQAAGFLTMVVAARGLEPAAFGRYAFTVILAALLAQIPGSGLDLAAVRVSARYWERAPEQARGVLLTAGALKLCVSLLLVALLVGLADPLARIGVLRPDVVTPIRYAALSAFALALTDLALSTLQAQERFEPTLMINLFDGLRNLQ
jgi:O-antigen/teichoic acid export membrane protein